MFIEPEKFKFCAYEGTKKQFDLYFAGSCSAVVEKYLMDKEVNRLTSQLLERKVFKEWRTHIAETKATNKLLVDSGAYTAHKSDKKVDVDDYIKYLNENDEYIHIAAQLDTIPGKFRQYKSSKDLTEAPEKSYENFLYMLPKLKTPEKLLPIYHQGEHLKWLEKIVASEVNGEPVQYMGISPANDRNIEEKEKFIEDCFNIISKSNNPNIKTHAFGLTTLSTLERYPFTSADSTTWLISASYGYVMTPYGTISVSHTRAEAPDHINAFQPKEREFIINFIEEQGYTYSEVQEHYLPRMKFNIDYLTKWANEYHYRPPKFGRTDLF